MLITERCSRSWSFPVYRQSGGTNCTVAIRHQPGGRLTLLSARPVVTFLAAEHRRYQLYSLVTEAHRCEQLAHGCYAAFARSRIWTHDLLIASPTLLRHCALGDRFWRSVRHMMYFHKRKCLLGVMLILFPILCVKVPKTHLGCIYAFSSQTCKY